MLTDAKIQNLIEMPKLVVSKTPGRGYTTESNQRRCRLELVADGDPDKQFTIFIRQNTNFIENFSIGLRYRDWQQKASNSYANSLQRGSRRIRHFT